MLRFEQFCNEEKVVSWQPNAEEQNAAAWLQSLFDFPTQISYTGYDYGTRHTIICITSVDGYTAAAVRSHDPYGRDPNAVKLMQFAWKKLPTGKGQWYDAGTGFYIPYTRVLELKERMQK